MDDEQTRMRALTLWQPWAWAIPRFKDVENRPWAPPAWLLGRRFAIHAAKRTIDLNDERLVIRVWLDRREPGLADMDPAEYEPLDFPRGAVTAVAMLIGWCAMEAGEVRLPSAACGDFSMESIRSQIAASSHASGPFCWLLDSRIELPRPVPCRGYQKLWTLPPDVEAEVRRQIEEAATRL